MTGNVDPRARTLAKKQNAKFVDAMREAHPEMETPVEKWETTIVAIPAPKKSDRPTRAELVAPMPEEPGSKTIRGIALQVAQKHGVRISDLKGPRKFKDFVAARHEAFWRCYLELPHKSLPQIGRWFGGRDHSTVHHGYLKHERLEQLKQANGGEHRDPATLSTVSQQLVHKPPRWSRKDGPLFELDCRSGNGTDDSAPSQVPHAG